MVSVFNIPPASHYITQLLSKRIFSRLGFIIKIVINFFLFTKPGDLQMGALGVRRQVSFENVFLKAIICSPTLQYTCSPGNVIKGRHILKKKLCRKLIQFLGLKRKKSLIKLCNAPMTAHNRSAKFYPLEG